jgi:hypothetical protein
MRLHASHRLQHRQSIQVPCILISVYLVFLLYVNYVVLGSQVCELGFVS